MQQAPIISPALELSDTRMAACLDTLGFPARSIDATLNTEERDPKKKVLIKFMFELASVRYPELTDCRALLHEYQSGALAKRDPMHKLIVMGLANHNCDCLNVMQSDRYRPMRLVSKAKGAITCYKEGQEIASLVNFPELVPTDDHCLASALGLVGLPVVKITGVPGARMYWVPRFGHAVRCSDGAIHRYDAKLLIQCSPTKEDPYRLALEVSQPDHPLCVGYDVLHHRRVLKAGLKDVKPLLLVQKGGHAIEDGTGKATVLAHQAMFHANADGRVMAEVDRHMKSPPIPRKQS